MRIAALVGSFALSLAACAPSAGTSASSASIINGKPESNRPGVVELFIPIAAGVAGCTATLIGTRTLISAAHCIDGSTGLPHAHLPGPNVDIDATSATMDPAYDGSSNDFPASQHDASIIVLADDVAGVEPSLLSTTAPQVGEALHIVGYGITSNDGSDYGTLLGGDNVISEVDAGYYKFAKTDSTHATICHGDSGGPDFVPFNGRDVITGVHSRGTCDGHELWGLLDETEASSTRVDTEMDFIKAQTGDNLYLGDGHYEKAPPTITIDVPPTAVTGDPLTLKVTAEDDVRITHVVVAVDANQIVDDTLDQTGTNYNLPLALTAGTHLVTASVTDGANNLTTASATITIAAQVEDGTPDAGGAAGPDGGIAATTPDAAQATSSTDAPLPGPTVAHGCSVGGSSTPSGVAWLAVVFFLVRRRRAIT